MYTHTNGLLRNRQEHASLVALDQKKASHATVYPSVFASYDPPQELTCEKVPLHPPHGKQTVPPCVH